MGGADVLVPVSQLRVNAFRKLDKLNGRTSIIKSWTHTPSHLDSPTSLGGGQWSRVIWVLLSHLHQPGPHHGFQQSVVGAEEPLKDATLGLVLILLLLEGDQKTSQHVQGAGSWDGSCPFCSSLVCV